MLAGILLLGVARPAQQQVGSIRGVVYDKDFNCPLGAVKVTVVETDQKATSANQGNYIITRVPQGKYTLVFSKEGYVRQVKGDVVVSAGRLTEVNIRMSGDFTEMEEFVVRDLMRLAPGTEAALLKLRFECPALLDSISHDWMSRAGASDAASALKLVAGASVKDGKSAVIRGLPDRYVSSQMNGVRLPTADEDKRAVELDQFPAVVIESIQVSKTFTPDQQGDASGGAVDVRLKGIPDKPLFLNFKGQYSFNSQVVGESKFLSYKGGGVNFWGRDRRRIQVENIDRSWTGAVGVDRQRAPIDSKWSVSMGGKHEYDSGIKIGGFLGFFYEKDSSFFDNGTDDALWVAEPGKLMSPKPFQGTVQEEDFNTELFDVTSGKQSVQWGGLATFGVEFEKHSLDLTYLYTRTAEDTATLAEDTRGKAFFFPGYDPKNLNTPGHNKPDFAPYIRNETLQYTERTTQTLQLSGQHTLPIEEIGPFLPPELDWVLAFSSADLDQPDKRQFGSVWLPERRKSSSISPPVWSPHNPASNATLGNLQRIWKEIEEESQQVSLNLKWPFKQWSDEEGYLKLGLFDDRVDRKFDQDTFSNLQDTGSFEGGFHEFWSKAFPFENHPIKESHFDVDYKGDLMVSAAYAMADFPFSSFLSVIGGVRFESTEIDIRNAPEKHATWYPPGKFSPSPLEPGDGDVSFDRNAWLPSIGLVFEPIEHLTLRGSMSRTVARQTFKELTPIMQQEFLGGPIFIGNPVLQMSELKNYDLRLDYTPYEGGLISVSWFWKDIDDPIEYVQKVVSFTYTTAENYPEGRLTGWEFEMRQNLGHFWTELEGLSLGANATFISSRVTLSDAEAAEFAHSSVQAPMDSRDMTSAPEYLYNLYMTYDLKPTDTQASLFYSVQGDTLVAGAGLSRGRFVPNVYAREYGTLNLGVSQKLGKYIKLQLRAKNLTNPDIKTVYRSKYIGNDVKRSSYSKGIEYSISLSADIPF